MTGKTPFKFFATIDDPYMISFVDRFMLNFSSRRWKNRQKPIDDEGKEWILDSGGFSEIKKHGEYSYNIDKYLQQVEFLNPTYFATMDWMCEPAQVKNSGLSVDQHIGNTVQNTVKILERWDGEATPLPVIQGWDLQDYKNCIDLMGEFGVFDVVDYVGLGSVCREEKDERLKQIIVGVADYLPEHVRLHGFGLKKTMLKHVEVVEALHSSDSMAWSMSNEYTHDLRGHDRREYLASWARQVELLAYETLLEKRLNNAKPEKQTTLAELD